MIVIIIIFNWLIKKFNQWSPPPPPPPPPTFGKKYPVCPVLTALSSNDKAKSLFPS